MTFNWDAETSDLIDGLFATDMGCADSGIRDTLKKAQLKEWMGGQEGGAFRLGISRHVRKHFLSEEALGAGYGLEDVAVFLRWLEDEMEVAL